MKNCQIRNAALLSIVLSLFLAAGCASQPRNNPQSTAADYRHLFAYQPEIASTQINASATVEASATLSPEMRRLWKIWIRDDQKIEGYMTALAKTLISDLTDSKLFTNTKPPGSGKPDYLIIIQSEEVDPANFRLRVTMKVVDPTNGEELFTRTEEAGLGLTGNDAGSITINQTPNYP